MPSSVSARAPGEQTRLASSYERISKQLGEMDFYLKAQQASVISLPAGAERELLSAFLIKAGEQLAAASRQHAINQNPVADLVSLNGNLVLSGIYAATIGDSMVRKVETDRATRLLPPDSVELPRELAPHCYPAAEFHSMMLDHANWWNRPCHSLANPFSPAYARPGDTLRKVSQRQERLYKYFRRESEEDKRIGEYALQLSEVGHTLRLFANAVRDVYNSVLADSVQLTEQQPFRWPFVDPAEAFLERTLGSAESTDTMCTLQARLPC